VKAHALRDADRKAEHGGQRMGICTGSGGDLKVLGKQNMATR